MPKPEILIFTDGACDPNPGPGGWAAILIYGRHEKILSGGHPQTTNNRMELQAALAALRALKYPSHVTLYTDSEYLRQGITEWLPVWQARGWRTSTRQPVQNRDLWEALVTETERHEVDWQWVKGHAGDPLNERVDRLARDAIPRREETPPDAAVGAVQLFTRASCLGAPGPGGWAVVIEQGDEHSSLTGSDPETTVNAMELEAAIQGLTALAPSTSVQLYTVSQYLYSGITRWVANWRARGWLTRGGEPVANREKWEALLQAVGQHQVDWRLLAHDRPSQTQEAARLAAQAARAAQEGSSGSASGEIARA
jgi:ribonuclease HI